VVNIAVEQSHVGAGYTLGASGLPLVAESDESRRFLTSTCSVTSVGLDGVGWSRCDHVRSEIETVKSLC
jgi:hypothetical protein